MKSKENRLLNKANNAFLEKNYQYALQIYNESLKKYKNTVLESIIKNIATSYFENPVIKINILNFDVSVLGEVNNPGVLEVASDTLLNQGILY